jgi:hypothetical protein
VTTQTLPRLGAVCGMIFPVGLFVSAGRYSLWGAALLSIALFLPFLAYLCSQLRHAQGEQSWLAQAAFAAGIAAITLKLASVAPEIAIHRLHIADGTSLHSSLQGIADAATDVCLYPLGLMLTAVALAALHTHVLPRLLSIGAGLTAVALVVNGTYNLYYHTGSIPAFLLFLLWTLVTSIVLIRETRPERVATRRAAQATS